jgi:hypothetical protein
MSGTLQQIRIIKGQLGVRKVFYRGIRMNDLSLKGTSKNQQYT